MSQPISSFVSGVFASLLAAVALTTLPSSIASSAENCMAEPNAKIQEGSQWSYRIDRASGRKCWFVVRPGSRTPPAEAEKQPSPDATPEPTFSSFFSSLVAPFKKANQAGTQQDPANSAARITQPTAPSAQRNNDDGRRPRVADSQNSNAPADQKQHRQSSARSEHAGEQRPAEARHQAQQDALFQEFLRWKERQTP
jgi:type II secretory pathway pseudopilin PulG